MIGCYANENANALICSHFGDGCHCEQSDGTKLDVDEGNWGCAYGCKDSSETRPGHIIPGNMEF